MTQQDKPANRSTPEVLGAAVGNLFAGTRDAAGVARRAVGSAAEKAALADAHPDEIDSAMPGDQLVSRPDFSATRAVTIAAEPSEVWPWLAQMGMGRAGWYSWDVLDNLGRKSATTLHPEWMVREPGEEVPGGPFSFTAAVVDRLNALVLHVDDERMGPWRVDFTLAYDLRLISSGTRLVTRARGRVNGPAGHLAARRLLGPGDGVMVTKQLREIARRAEGRI